MSNFGKPWTVADLTAHLQRKPEARVAHIPPTPSAIKPVKVATVQPVTGNKKIRGATKVEINRVRYDSKLEATMARLLQDAGISYEFQKCYCLQEGFTYQGRKIRPMTLTVDFWLPQFDLIIDSKGWKNDVAPVKYKLLKFLLKSQGQEPSIEMPATVKECNSLVLTLLSRKTQLQGNLG